MKKLLLLLAGLFIIACGSMDVESFAYDDEEVSTQDNPVVDEDSLSAKVDELISETNIGADEGPGGAVMVIQDGNILHQKGYGLADIDTGKPITPETIFHLGSVSKQFTALGVMILEQQGELDYDASIGEYFPELAWMGEEVTIRRLLQHTSGIPDYDENEDLYDALMAISEQPSNADVITALSEQTELLYEPGSEFLYSNTGYDVLGALIESISGQSYPDFMEENIFSKLGMQDTFAVPDPARLKGPNVSVSYMDEGGEPQAYEPDPLDDINGSGSTYSNLTDFFLYDQALYGDEILSQDALEEAFIPATLDNGKSTDYGFAWDVTDYQGETYYGHSGAWLGFSSYYVRFPERQLSIVLLLNFDYLQPYDDETLVFKIADLYLE
ncbi:MAG: beta-lactamase family protein [Anaerolineales bacterium]|nr:beta-lactamase family protein [Anaerolineales bacterium]